MFKTLRGKKKKTGVEKGASAAEIRLVEVKNEVDIGDMPPTEELNKEFEDLLVCITLSLHIRSQSNTLLHTVV
jgi:hypothetical protein